MEDLGWKRRRGSSPVARRGAQQRAGLTPASASNTLSCHRETLHPNQISSIKNPLDSDHGIYRDSSLFQRFGFLSRDNHAQDLRMRQLYVSGSASFQSTA